MILLHAKPYNIDATGFNFSAFDEFNEKAAQCYDRFNTPVEEFEIFIIEADDIDCHFFEAWGVHQGNIQAFFEAVSNMDDHTKIALIAMAECGYTIDEDTDAHSIDLYYHDTIKDLAEQFIENGHYGDIPENLEYYIDYDAIARDLEMDYTSLKIGDQRIVYRCP